MRGHLAMDDVAAVGEKIIEMADRVRVGHAVLPGSQTIWVFDMDGTRYKVVVTVEGKAK